MKRILIAGSGSYIGESFKSYLQNNFCEDYSTDTVDMTDPNWKSASFAGYDSVFYVAGIAHRKETKENAQLYYQVNRDLTLEAALKAKREGARQFIFLSSMSVYGVERGVIRKDTVPMPKSNYGKSKYQAELKLNELVDDTFKLCILRPPMVYGRGCKGNFQSIVKLVKKLPVFPRINNKRSMIYIDNLSSFVKRCIDKDLEGVYAPQNSQYMNTADMAKHIAEGLGKKIWLSRVMGLCVKCLIPFVGVAKKAFGSLTYAKEFDELNDYAVADNQISVKTSVAERV